MGKQVNLTLSGLKKHYLSGDFSPADLIDELLQRSLTYAHKNIWIRQLNRAEIQPYLDALAGDSPESRPLYGVPFAIKDNIDLAGIPTTAACPAFAYTPDRSAFVVEQLIAAGAIPIGKTNMDQLATGLVGVRSPEPWGACRNAFDDAYISGGSSAGSAIAVALGLCSFSLGTDTAGSGRVPAAMNNLVGLKPSRGLLSTAGVVPACRSLDAVSIFALNSTDARAVFHQAAVFDAADTYARLNPFSNSVRVAGIGDGALRIGVPRADQLEFFGDRGCESLFLRNLTGWRELGAELVEVDFSPFLQAARLLYEGPWVAERYLAARKLVEDTPEALHPTIRSIIEPAAEHTALAAFEASYRLSALKRLADAVMSDLDVMITPTIPAQYTIAQVQADPIMLNSRLGTYTNFMNLLDYSAIAVPGGFTEVGIPSGFTLFGLAFEDQKLLAWAQRWQDAQGIPAGACTVPYQAVETPRFQDSETVKIVVCGAHLEGLPLNWQLTERGGKLLEHTKSAACYRLFALSDGVRPGMVRDEGGQAIEVEVWQLPRKEFGDFVAHIPAPLGIGKVELQNGRWESGFICEPYGLAGARDVTQFGGWRAWLAARS